MLKSFLERGIKMEITNELIKHLESLAKIRLKEDEVSKIKKDMSDILEYMKMIDEVDVSGYEPMRSPVENALELRKDVPVNFDASKIMKQVPKIKNGLIQVSSISSTSSRVK